MKVDIFFLTIGLTPDVGPYFVTIGSFGRSNRHFRTGKCSCFRGGGGLSCRDFWTFPFDKGAGGQIPSQQIVTQSWQFLFDIYKK